MIDGLDSGDGFCELDDLTSVVSLITYPEANEASQLRSSAYSKPRVSPCATPSSRSKEFSDQEGHHCVTVGPLLTPKCVLAVPGHDTTI